MLPIIDQGKGVISTEDIEKEFDKLSPEEKKRRIERFSLVLTKTKEARTPNELMEALLNEDKMDELAIYPEVYQTSYQLPFSKEKLILSMDSEKRIWFSVSDEPLIEWTGVEGDYERIFKYKFSTLTLRDETVMIQFVNNVIGEISRYGMMYFTNLKRA